MEILNLTAENEQLQKDVHSLQEKVNLRSLFILSFLFHPNERILAGILYPQ